MRSPSQMGGLDINSMDETGKTLLYSAMEHRKTHLAEILMERKADVVSGVLETTAWRKTKALIL
jgi:hypothetical protein